MDNINLYKELGLNDLLKLYLNKKNGKEVEKEEKEILHAIEELLTYKINEEEKFKDFFSIDKKISDYDRHLDNPEKLLPTGLKSFDTALNGGIGKGLTLLGAPSSMGKTTLCLNIAIKLILQYKINIIYYSLEMNKERLVDKIISNICYENFGIKVSDRDVMNSAKELISAKNFYYDNIAPFLHIITFKRIPTIEDIEKVYECFKDNITTKEKPVLFIDYLQIIRNEDTRMTDKQQVDYNATRLLELTNNNELSTICISSLNRDSYKTNKLLNITCLKDSGDLEYSAENVLALQFRNLRILNDTTFNEEKEKKKEERELEIVSFKSRFGDIGHYNLNYNAKYNTFKDVDNVTINDMSVTHKQFKKR